MSAPRENTTANARKMDDMAQRYPMQMINVSETNANRALGTGQAEHQVMSQTIDAIISHAGSGFRDLGMAKSK
jgi:hypothetical protein